MKCFIVGCKSSNKPKNNEKKRSFFSAPKDEEVFKAWQKAVTREDKAFGKNHMLCDLHFQPEDVLSEFVHHMPDGNIVRFKRDKIKLKKGAVPTIFHKNDPIPSIFSKKTLVPAPHANVLTVPDEIKTQIKENLQKVPKPIPLVYFNIPSQKSREITSPSSRRISTKSHLQYSPQSPSQLYNSALPNIVNLFPLPTKIKIELNENNSKKIPKPSLRVHVNNDSKNLAATSMQFSVSVSEESSSQDSLQMCSQVFSSSSPDVRQRLYSKICKECTTNSLLVPLSRGIWISNRISTHQLQCIMWCLWKEDASKILKRITVFGDMTLKIYIDEKPVSIPDIGNVQTVEDIARVLSEVGENIIPCSKVDGRKRSRNCSGYVRRKNTTLESSFQDDRCVHCTECLMTIRHKLSYAQNAKRLRK